MVFDDLALLFGGKGFSGYTRVLPGGQVGAGWDGCSQCFSGTLGRWGKFANIIYVITFREGHVVTFHLTWFVLHTSLGTGVSVWHGLGRLRARACDNSSFRCSKTKDTFQIIYVTLLGCTTGLGSGLPPSSQC